MNTFGYYQGLFNGLQKSNSGLDNLYNVIGDYNTIQKGTYKRLLSSYFETGKTNEAEEKLGLRKKDTKEEDDNSEYTTTKKFATALSDAAQGLSATKHADIYDEEKEEDLAKEVTTFVKAYNDAYKNAGKSSSSKLRNLANGLKENTKSYEEQLKKIGITMDEDNKLSVDTEVLKKADASNVKNLLGSGSSFVGKTMRLAAQICSGAAVAASGVTTYDATGSYSATGVSGYYDLFS